MGTRGIGATGQLTAKDRARALARRHPWNTGEASIEKAKPWELEGVSRRTWYRRQKTSAKPQAGSATRADRVLTFLGELPVPSGVHAGKKFQAVEWECDAVRALYATGEDGQRIIRQSLITLPRKNGKTGFVAGLCLAHLCGPEAEKNGEIYSAAADRDQAAIIFRMMRAIINETPWMKERLVVRVYDKTIEDIGTGSVYKALSADAGTKHGTSSSFVVYDELAQAANRNLFDVLATSGGARAEPLFVVISTQSADPNHVMQEMVDYGRKVSQGTIPDEHFHAVIYEAPMDADPWAEDTWVACNPGLPHVRSLKELRSQAAQAQRIPSREPAFRNLYLNQPVDPEPSFMSLAEWRACNAPVDRAALRGRLCYGGLDLADVRDLNAVTLYFPDDGSVLSWAWVAEGALREKSAGDKVPYDLWADSGQFGRYPAAP